MAKKKTPVRKEDDKDARIRALESAVLGYKTEAERARADANLADMNLRRVMAENDRLKMDLTRIRAGGN